MKNPTLNGSRPAWTSLLPLRRSLWLGLLGVLLAAMPILAGSSATYTVPWETVARGGNEMASTNYRIQSTTGQSIIGPSAGSNYALGAGYWYGVREPTHVLFLPLILRSF